MSIYGSNIKSIAQRESDNVQSAQIADWCKDRRDSGNVIEFSSAFGDVDTTDLTRPRKCDTAGLLVICTPKKARGLARPTMQLRQHRAMDTVSRGVDFRGYDEKNKRQAFTWEQADRVAMGDEGLTVQDHPEELSDLTHPADIYSEEITAAQALKAAAVALSAI